MILKKYKERLRRKLCPTDQERRVDKWFADGGDEKFRYSYNLQPQSIVVDLGGYEGLWAQEIFNRFQCQIMIFEPVKKYAENIQKRFHGNNNIKVFQCGLAGSNGKHLISLCEDASSLYDTSETSETSEEIEVIDVADWLSRESINTIDLMKINIEGGEYDLLERLMEIEYIKYIYDIQIQFHEISSDSVTRMERIQKHLSKTHELTYQYRFVMENWKRKNNIQE